MGNEKNPCSEEQGRIYRGTTLVTALLPSLEIVNADLRRNILFYSTALTNGFQVPIIKSLLEKQKKVRKRRSTFLYHREKAHNCNHCRCRHQE